MNGASACSSGRRINRAASSVGCCRADTRKLVSPFARLRQLRLQDSLRTQERPTRTRNCPAPRRLARSSQKPHVEMEDVEAASSRIRGRLSPQVKPLLSAVGQGDSGPVGIGGLGTKERLNEVPAPRGKASREGGGCRRVTVARGNQGALPWLSAKPPRALAFTCDPRLDTIVAMDLVDWVEEAESLLRLDGLWPEQDEERARGVLEEAALQGPAAVTHAIHALRRELRERDRRVRGQSAASGWIAFRWP